jgi:hypothetical protein
MKKGQGISVNMMIIIVIALVVLVICIALVTKQFRKGDKTIGDNTNCPHTCDKGFICKDGFSQVPRTCPNAGEICCVSNAELDAKSTTPTTTGAGQE